MGRRRFTAVAASGDHGLLLGLGDDDHAQYFLANCTRAFAGDPIPDGVDTRSLGSAARELRNLYLGEAGRLYVGLAQQHSIRAYPTINDLEIVATTRYLLLLGQMRAQLLANAYYDGAAYQRLNVANPAWSVNADIATDFLRVSRVAAGANPIAWATLMTLVAAGQLQLPVTGAAAGILLGGDALIYRGAANRLDLDSGDSLNLVLGDITLAATRTVDGVDPSMYTKAWMQWSGLGTNISGGSTMYLGPDGPYWSENPSWYPVPEAATAVALYVYVDANGLSGATTVTLRKNSANTAITLSIPGGGFGVFSDVAHNVAFAAGDLASIKVVAGADGGAAIVIIGVTVKFAQSAA